jgi:hypothetical protein
MYDSRPVGNLIMGHAWEVLYWLFAKAGIPYMSVITCARAATMRRACMAHTLSQQLGRLPIQACRQVYSPLPSSLDMCSTPLLTLCTVPAGLLGTMLELVTARALRWWRGCTAMGTAALAPTHLASTALATHWRALGSRANGHPGHSSSRGFPWCAASPNAFSCFWGSFEKVCVPSFCVHSPHLGSKHLICCTKSKGSAC